LVVDEWNEHRLQENVLVFARYNLSLPESAIHWLPAAQDNAIKEAGEIRARVAIEDFMKGGAVDAAGLEDAWFGQSDYHIFISHSHRDIALATAIASHMHKSLGLNCFVDSLVWNYADDLLLALDNRFCKRSTGNTYSYQRRNRSTSHVHMMLAASLAKVIKRSECILFLNTPNSLASSDGLAASHITDSTAQTASPWIYYELLMTKVLGIERPDRLADVSESYTVEAYGFDSALPDFNFRPPIEHLTELSSVSFKRWLGCGKRATNALDALYQSVPPLNAGSRF
jgi:hypothetical protein